MAAAPQLCGHEKDLGGGFVVRRLLSAARRVSSRRERILQASDEWAAQRFAPVPGGTDFIPLPPTRFTPPEPLS